MLLFTVAVWTVWILIFFSTVGIEMSFMSDCQNGVYNFILSQSTHMKKDLYLFGQISKIIRRSYSIDDWYFKWLLDE